jgi:hypothetical protein
MQSNKVKYDPLNKDDDHALSVAVAKGFIAETAHTIERTNELTKQCKDARDGMDVLCAEWNQHWLEFQKHSDERLRLMRMTRASFDSENRQLLNGLRDVRAFFLDKDYDLEVSRLKDFVETCERLKKLKDSGFLDTVADTMLRLAETKPI